VCNAVTVAPISASWFSSVTTPERAEVVTWALADNATTNIATKAKSLTVLNIQKLVLMDEKMMNY
jgi:hypothetical protein